MDVIQPIFHVLVRTIHPYQNPVLFPSQKKTVDICLRSTGNGKKYENVMA